jgi:hypothetical protein
MPTDLTSREEMPSSDANWFGVAGSVFAWIALGIGDIVITWRACINPEQFGGPSSHPAARIMYLVITFILFGVAIVAGIACYQHWRRLRGLAKLLQAEGRERNEFMALAGMFMSLTLGAGIVWLCIPLFILQMCIRAR